MRKPHDNPAQLTFTVFLPPTVTATGDGYVVRPGRPIVKLSAGQLAAHFGMNRQSVYRWRQEGLIPDQFVTRAGERKLLFDAEVIPHLEAHFKAIHE